MFVTLVVAERVNNIHWCFIGPSTSRLTLGYSHLSVIARRRIQHSTETIGLLIDQCDLVELPPEHAELLLKFVPTKEEVTKIYCFAYNNKK